MNGSGLRRKDGRAAQRYFVPANDGLVHDRKRADSISGSAGLGAARRNAERGNPPDDQPDLTDSASQNSRLKSSTALRSRMRLRVS